MDTIEHSNQVKIHNFRTVAGLLLILVGGILFLDRYLKTGWLSLLVLPAVGLFLYLWGVRRHHSGLILAGGLIAGFGMGSMAAWGSAVRIGVPAGVSPYLFWRQLGLLALYTGAGWGIVIVTFTLLKLRPIWWALVPGGVLAGLGYCLVFTPLRLVDFVLCVTLGVGVPLLLWGEITRLFGLVIPGCLLLGIGPGIYLAWRTPTAGNGLTQTGIMLVWFSLGWILITIAEKRISHQYIWWPLIPGGILAMVGTGLYIGGDPGHALGFIGNTGSIALMIFGLYLLLMRKGIHH